MRVSYKWLKEYVDVPFSPNDLARELTFRGVAVETVTDLDPGIENVCVGEIRSIETHPAADRLLVCRIDVGGEVLTIVTGAPNLHVGDKVPAAKPGSRLPRGWAIGATDFRGVVSQGMLCSETELLEGNPHKENEGIWILPSDARPGTSMAELLDLDDAILELDLTPNYASHCLSMVGVAREVAAITGGRVRLPETEAPASPRALEESPVEDMISIDIEARDLCDRYTARVIKNVRIGPSPLWMQNRLRAAGMRPINNIVDVTNYVMLELGQPLHAFDYEAIRG
ncbi:MAG: phenylalanine--tRNA ligase subunit beta, partial [Actinobacteria bacterium]|nr:phenylalanine--tRNA ligase subunit beta [Actinomycetota bacterium]